MALKPSPPDARISTVPLTTTMAQPFIDLQPLIANPSASRIEVQLLDVFDAVVNALPATELSAETTAGELDDLYSTGKGEKDAEEFLWALWTLVLGVAKKVPPTDERMQLLVWTVDKLRHKDKETVTIWNEQVKVWGDLPLLGACAREAWNVQPKFDGSDADETDETDWISLNSFSARIYGASIQPWSNFAIWALREALEEEPASSRVDGQLTTAYEWILHAGETMYEQVKADEPKELDEATTRLLRPGKLAKDIPAGFNKQRWNFWVNRLEELGPKAESGHLKDQTAKMVEKMKALQS